MTATDQLRAALHDLEAKARELELDRKLEALAERADHYLHEAAVKAGDYAHENRGRVEEAIDKAEAGFERRTDGKYARYAEKVRTGVLSGVDWVAAQRESSASSTPGWSEQGARYTRTPDAGAAPETDTAATETAAGSADSAPWVDVTDTPPAQDPTDRP